MTGTPNQIELAEQILPTVTAEFDRVARLLRTAALHQTGQRKTETGVILEILAEQRAQVLARPEAGYFITTWRELNDQVRQLIAHDPRHLAIRTRRAQQGHS
jgi:hypothetical protein